MIFLVKKIVKLCLVFIVRGTARKLKMLLGVDISRKVKIGTGVSFPHNFIGRAIHPNTILKDNVKSYQSVSLRRTDIYRF